ncbi:TetR/AcrR family transcriptional regulator [Streptomyces sp. BR123]|uniref:TetR/AcrR family transcriptional regulator n=1 Tax=Streptomyces sp. BR123 TaxID=2749828 RepID=UPI0015C4413C|nr:TetR/AcrR family transcriptional regulator [Streptomyces sp. BR123]NXY99293.1 TetR/AcrR family transcriptional regulator [Streptomyces sp. BR123]
MSSAAVESGTRSRTRRAILGAAAEVLARDRAATLADIAKAAQVGRSTLHRYFADREVLVKAAAADAYLVIQQSILGAAVDEGPPLEAMRRLVAAMVGAGDRLLFLYGDSAVLEGFEAGDEPDSVDRMVGDLITRGQAEGVFDPDVAVQWIQGTLWALVYAGCESASRGVLPRHGVTATVIRTLENGIRARG